MSKYWSAGVLIGVVLLAFVIISLRPIDLAADEQLKELSGRTISGNNAEFCATICDNDARYFFAQPNNPSISRSYSIREGDYFSVRATSTTHFIKAIYRHDGLVFNNPKAIATTSPLENTDNYVKLSLVYAKTTDRESERRNEDVYKFNCDGKQILVPIPGRTLSPLGYHRGKFGGVLDSYTNSHKFAEVKIYPFEDSGIGNDPSFFGFQLRPYARAEIMTIGADPAEGTADNLITSNLL